VNNSNIGRISHCLATIARNGLQNHPRSFYVAGRMALPISD